MDTQNVDARLAMTLIVRAINAWLSATKAGYRIDAAGIVMTRHNGTTFLALPENVENDPAPHI